MTEVVFISCEAPLPQGSEPLPPPRVTQCPEEEARRLHHPRDAVLVLPARSASHARSAIRAACRAYVGRLHVEEPGAHVAIARYGDGAHSACLLTPVALLNELERALDQAYNIDGTRYWAGLSVADGIAGSGRTPFHVVLVIDAFDERAVYAAAYAVRLKRRALIDCVACCDRPDQVDEDELRTIATANADGSSRYRWFDSPAGLIRHFYDLAGRVS